MRFLGVASLALAVLMIGLSSIQAELSRQSLYSLSTAFWSEFRRLLADTHAPPGTGFRRPTVWHWSRVRCVRWNSIRCSARLGRFRGQ